MNKVIKVKDNKQKLKGACPAQTEDDSEPQPKITTSCPACSNTFVACSTAHFRLLKDLQNANRLDRELELFFRQNKNSHF